MNPKPYNAASDRLPFEPDPERLLAAIEQRDAQIAKLVRTLLFVEWDAVTDTCPRCRCWRSAGHGVGTLTARRRPLSVLVSHEEPCPLDAMLTAMNLPTQAERDAQRACSPI